MPSVTAQDPASEPARIAEGILPLRMKRGNFVISGAMWRKFNANRPWLTFAEFWLIKEHAYNQRNEQSKHFFDNFTCDAEKHHQILRDRFIRREVKLMLNKDVHTCHLLGYLSRRRGPWMNSMGTIASCTEKKVPSFKVTDGSPHLLQGQVSKRISGVWPKI